MQDTDTSKYDAFEEDLKIVRKLQKKGIRNRLLEWKKETAKAINANINSTNKNWVSDDEAKHDPMLYCCLQLAKSRDLITEKTHPAIIRHITDQQQKIKNLGDKALFSLFNDGRASGTDLNNELPRLFTARFIQATFSGPIVGDTGRGWVLANHSLLTELFNVEGPSNMTGSAKALEEGSMPTAFITGECTKARGHIGRAFLLTAQQLSSVRQFLEDLQLLLGIETFSSKAWRTAELKRLLLAFINETSYRRKRALLDIRIDSAIYEHDGTQDASEKIKDVLQNVLESLIQATNDLLRAARYWIRENRYLESRVQNILNKIKAGMQFDKALKRQIDNTEKLKTIFSQSANLIANFKARSTISVSANAVISVLEDLIAKCGTLKSRAGRSFTQLKEVNRPQYFEDVLNSIRDAEKKFTGIEIQVKNVSKQCIPYLQSVLTNQSMHFDTPDFDLGEFVFAAASLSELAPTQFKHQVEECCAKAARYIEENGIPVFCGTIALKVDGSQLCTYGSEIVRAFTQLVANTNFQISETLIERMMEFFESIQCRNTSDEKKQLHQFGFYSNPHSYPQKFSRIASTLALLAMDKTCRMLDRFINSKIQQHLDVTENAQIKSGLNELSYGDYGVAEIPAEKDIGIGTYEYNREAERTSVAFQLELMRSHIIGSADEKHAGLFSAVFFGPPGTGKTTFPKALAKSSNVQFVKVTPSVLKKYKEAAIEAVGYLRNCVVLVDEADPAIEQRIASNPQEKSFLTNALLEKFEEVYNQFKDSGSVCILSTNRISVLDAAAIRKRRFDLKIGILHPDMVSIQGMVAKRLYECNLDCKVRKRKTLDQMKYLAKNVFDGVKDSFGHWGLLNIELVTGKGNFVGKWVWKPEAHLIGTLNHVAIHKSKIRDAFKANLLDWTYYLGAKKDADTDKLTVGLEFCEYEQVRLWCELNKSFVKREFGDFILDPFSDFSFQQGNGMIPN